MTQDEKLILAHKFYDALKEGKLSVIIGSDNYGNESILVKLKNQKVHTSLWSAILSKKT